MHVFPMEHKSRQNSWFVEKANNFHSTIKFTTEMSKTEIYFLDTKVYKGVDQIQQGIYTGVRSIEKPGFRF